MEYAILRILYVILTEIMEDCAVFWPIVPTFVPIVPKMVEVEEGDWELRCGDIPH